MALNQVGLERLNSATTDKLGERKNKIINGNMIVSQRHGTAVVTGVNSTGYRIDRWTHQIDSINSAFSVSQSTDTPDGFGASMHWDCTTADTSIAANEFFIVRYSFEGRDVQAMQKGTSSAKKVVLSFYAKATKTGTYIAELIDHDNSSRHVNKSYTISDTNWNRYEISFPADTTGTIDNDSNKSMDINFWLVAGSNYNSGSLQTAWGADTNANRAVGQVNAMDSTSNDFYLTGVQLEIDHSGLGVATDFEHRLHGHELALCERYYQDSFEYHHLNASNGESDRWIRFRTQMRASPTVTTSPTNSVSFGVHVTTANGFSGDGSGNSHANFNLGWTASAEL